MTTPDNTGSNYSARTKKNTRRLAVWTGGWIFTMAVANFGPLLVWPEQQWLTLTAIALNLLIGFGMINANRRHLMGLDELQQKIQLQAMGFTLGVGLVVGLAYSNLDVTNLIGGDAEISHLVMLMGVTYLIATLVGQRRYE